MEGGKGVGRTVAAEWEDAGWESVQDVESHRLYFFSFLYLKSQNAMSST